MTQKSSVEIPSENAIRSKWRNPDVPIITIICTTYNHETYVEDAIRGFLAQEMDVAFEVLIHDDCSTDGTAAILRRYQMEYPNIVRLVIQEKNTVSRGISPWITTFEMARGDYLAICEGDDYWTDSRKLQSQYSLMETTPELSFCCHNAEIEYVGTSGRAPFNQSRRSGVYSTSDVILDEWFIPTASLFLRKSSLPKWPQWFARVRSQDLALEIILSVAGPLWYDERMSSVYRKNAIGSFSAGQKKPWEYLYRRIFLFKSLLAWLPVSLSPLAAFDIVKSISKIVYSKARYRLG